MCVRELGSRYKVCVRERELASRYRVCEGTRQ